jgi:hypothetical protein
MLAPVFERDPRARDEVANGARHKHLPGTRSAGHAGSRVHRDAADLVSHQLALAGVDARPDLDPELANAFPDRPRCADGTRRPVQGREKAVAGRVDLAATEAVELAPDARMMLADDLAPAPVAELRRARRGIDDVGEEHRGENAVRLRKRTLARQELLYLVDAARVHDDQPPARGEPPAELLEPR